MTSPAELRAQLDRLRARMAEYRQTLAQAATAQERAELKGKVSAYRTAIRDVQVQLDHLDPPERRKARRAQRKKMDVGALSFDFFERSGACWSDLEGHSWQQVEAGDTVELGTSMEQLQQWMAQGAQRLTDRQREYLDAYYNRGLSLEAIGLEHGVDKSTVSRVMKNGLRRMQAWVESKKLIAACSDGRGGFDWAMYLSRVPVLTDRQRQLMLLVLSRCPKTQGDLAAKLELEESTVSRTLTKAGETIRALQVEGGRPTRTPAVHWEGADKFSLALETGMPLYFYYRFCFRRQRVAGLTRYQYELARRREAGEGAEEVAREMGISPGAVRAAFQRLRTCGVRVGQAAPPEEDTLAARLPPETYLALQRMVTARADP